jgi:hypothetical protein
MPNRYSNGVSRQFKLLQPNMRRSFLYRHRGEFPVMATPTPDGAASPTTISHLACAATSNPATFVALISAIAAVTAALIAYRQSRTARAKLKLDLYDKRFNIYVSALELYHAMMMKELKDIEEYGFIFNRMFREALFLFKQRDGVYNTLGEINDACVHVRDYERYMKEDNINRSAEEEKQKFSILSERAAAARRGMKPLLLQLERQLRKYLDFSKLK